MSGRSATITAQGLTAGRDNILVSGDYIAAPVTPMQRATPPAPPAHFTGREADLERFVQLLISSQDSATLALQGMSGIGKTALALKLAERLQGAGDAANRPYFPGGVLWWSLGPNPIVLTALDVWARHAHPHADLKDFPDLQARAAVVRSMLAELGQLCVIIDDVWDAESFNILKSAVPPGCPILITTRDGDLAKSLRCRVERIDALKEAEAIALLAKLLGPLNGQATAASEIAHLTEGLPLALELIAGLADAPADLSMLATQLRSKPMLDVLKRGPNREQSIEACFTLNYEQLDADTQRRFRALGVFAPAPFGREAVAAVWDEDGDAERVDAALRFLVRRSLLSKDETTGEYSQHTLLHDYAVKLLRATPAPARQADEASENARDEQRTGIAEGFRHAEYYRRFAQDQDWPAIEHAFDQIDGGWRWVQANASDKIAEYVQAVWKFLDARGRKLEVLTWLEVGLAQARTAKDRKNEGWFLSVVGYVYHALGQKEKALDLYRQALGIRREVGDRSGEGTTLNNLGSVYHALGQKETALDLYQQALRILREVGDRPGEGGTLNNLGTVYSALGRKEKAIDFYQRALRIRREVGDRPGESRTLNNLGNVYFAHDQEEKAFDFYQQALGISREVGDRSGEGATLGNIGAVYSALGQKETALDFYQQALSISREVGNHSGEGETLGNIGSVYSALGQQETALDFYQQALGIRREVGDRWGESMTLNNIGCLLDAMGRNAEAVTYLEQNVAVDEAIGHPNLESDRAMLERVRRKLNRRPSWLQKLRGR